MHCPTTIPLCSPHCDAQVKEPWPPVMNTFFLHISIFPASTMQFISQKTSKGSMLFAFSGIRGPNAFVLLRENAGDLRCQCQDLESWYQDWANKWSCPFLPKTEHIWSILHYQGTSQRQMLVCPSIDSPDGKFLETVIADIG